MKKTLCTFGIACGLLSADTLVLRDGRTLDGKMLSANGRTISFADSNGSRRDYNISSVQEISFTNSQSYGTRSRTAPSAYPSEMQDLMNRLHDNLTGTMDRANLSDEQRLSLDEARTALSKASDDMRDGRNINSADVRRSLDDIRSTLTRVSGVRPQDRRAVLADINRLQDSFNNFRSERYR